MVETSKSACNYTSCRSSCILELIQDGNQNWETSWKKQISQLQGTSLEIIEHLNELLSYIHAAFISKNVTVQLQAFSCWHYFLEQYDKQNLPMNDKMWIPLRARNHTVPSIVNAKIKAWDAYMNSTVLTTCETMNSAVQHLLKFLYDTSDYPPCAASYHDFIEICARLYLKTMDKSMHERTRRGTVFSCAKNVFKTLMNLKDDHALALRIWKEMLDHITEDGCSNDDMVYLRETIADIIYWSHCDQENLLSHLLKFLFGTYPDLAVKCLTNNEKSMEKCMKYASASFKKQMGKIKRQSGSSSFGKNCVYSYSRKKIPIGTAVNSKNSKVAFEDVNTDVNSVADIHIDTSCQSDDGVEIVSLSFEDLVETSDSNHDTVNDNTIENDDGNEAARDNNGIDSNCNFTISGKIPSSDKNEICSVSHTTETFRMATRSSTLKLSAGFDNNRTSSQQTKSSIPLKRGGHPLSDKKNTTEKKQRIEHNDIENNMKVPKFCNEQPVLENQNATFPEQEPLTHVDSRCSVEVMEAVADEANHVDVVKNAADEILFPSLVGCQDHINSLRPIMWKYYCVEELFDRFQNMSISSIGQLASMNVVYFYNTPLNNYVQVLKNYLELYYNKWKDGIRVIRTGAYYPVTMLGDSGQPELKNYDLSQNGQNVRLGTDKINTETMVHINEQPNLQNVKPTKLHDDNSEKEIDEVKIETMIYNDEQPMLTDDEHSELQSNEQFKLQNNVFQQEVLNETDKINMETAVYIDEQPKLQNNEQTELQNDEQTKLQNDEQIKSQNDEQIKLQNDEQIKLQNDEQIKLQNDEQIKLQNDEQIKLQNDEQIKLQNDEQIKLQNDEQIKLQNDEQIKLQNDDFKQSTRNESGKINVNTMVCNDVHPKMQHDSFRQYVQSEKDKINVGTIKHDDEQTEFQNNAFKGNGDNGDSSKEYSFTELVKYRILMAAFDSGMIPKDVGMYHLKKEKPTVLCDRMLRGILQFLKDMGLSSDLETFYDLFVDEDKHKKINATSNSRFSWKRYMTSYALDLLCFH